MKKGKKKSYKICPSCKEICTGISKRSIKKCKCGFEFKKKVKVPVKLPYLTNYNAYLVSPHWKKRREEFFKKNKYECQACGSGDYINLHHATYQRMGIEEEGDLVPLCRSCHSEAHEIQKSTGENLYKVTYDYIMDKNQQEELVELTKYLTSGYNIE